MAKNDKNCNNLSGKEWLQNSFSIWRELSKTKEEKDFKHPASYPVSLCEKLIKTFSKNNGKVLDPFNGIGSSMAAAHNLGYSGVGIDLSEEFCKTAKERINNDKHIQIINGDSFVEIEKFPDDYFDICITSPPYWDILNMKRSADGKKTVNYSDKNNDLGNILIYNDFISSLGQLFLKVQKTLKTGSYLIINVMDLRKKDKFYPLHSDIAAEMQKIGYIYDDLIIWDRQKDYNNMRPLGYPYKFRINKVHEYLLIFIKK
jgi:DNA modification methylase